MRKLRDINVTFGLKLIWLIFSKSGSLWVAWIKAHYLRDNIFWTRDFSRGASWIWRRLINLRVLARQHLVCNIVSGQQALFWHDNWTSSGPLILLTCHTGPMVTGISLLSTVSEAVSGSSWALPRGRHAITRMLRSALQNIPPSTGNTQPDEFMWKNGLHDVPGAFSSSKTYQSIQQTLPEVPWHRAVWFKERIPKHSFIYWVLMRDRLPTKDRMRNWGLNVNPECPLCNTALESTSHLFFECEYSTAVWLAFFNHPTLNPPRDMSNAMVWAQQVTVSSKARSICLLILQAAVYFIWRERNARLHSAGELQPSILVKQIHLLLRAKVAALDLRSKPINGSSLNHRDLRTPLGESFLYTWFKYFDT